MLNPQQKRRAARILSHGITVLLTIVNYTGLTWLYFRGINGGLIHLEQSSPHLIRSMAYASLGLISVEFYYPEMRIRGRRHLGDLSMLCLLTVLPIGYVLTQLQTGSHVATAVTVMWAAWMVSKQLQAEWNQYQPGYYTMAFPIFFWFYVSKESTLFRVYINQTDGIRNGSRVPY